MSNNNDFSTEKITPLNNLQVNLVNDSKLGDISVWDKNDGQDNKTEKIWDLECQ